MPEVKRLTEGCGAKLVKFRVRTDSSGPSGIDITQVEVVLRSCDAQLCGAVRQHLEKELGLAAVVESE